MEGEKLRGWLFLNHQKKGVQWLSDKLNITIGSVYEQLRKKKIGDSFRHKLDKAGLLFVLDSDNESPKPVAASVGGTSELLEVYKELNQVRVQLDSARQEIVEWKEEIILKEATIRDKDNEIIDLKKKMKEIERELASIKLANHG